MKELQARLKLPNANQEEQLLEGLCCAAVKAVPVHVHTFQVAEVWQRSGLEVNRFERQRPNSPCYNPVFPVA